jgi:hypothetical protein
LINRLQFKLDDRVVNHHFRAAFEYENGKMSSGWFRGNNSQHKLYDARLSRECKGAFRILFTRAINLRRATEWEGYFTWNGDICEVNLPIWDVVKIVEFSRNRRMCNWCIKVDTLVLAYALKVKLSIQSLRVSGS